MTVRRIFNMEGLVSDNMKIYIRSDMKVVANGNWYNDNIVDYLNFVVDSFTWFSNELYIDIKQ